MSASTPPTLLIGATLSPPLSPPTALDSKSRARLKADTLADTNDPSGAADGMFRSDTLVATSQEDNCNDEEEIGSSAANHIDEADEELRKQRLESLSVLLDQSGVWASIIAENLETERRQMAEEAAKAREKEKNTQQDLAASQPPAPIENEDPISNVGAGSKRTSSPRKSSRRKDTAKRAKLTMSTPSQVSDNASESSKSSVFVGKLSDYQEEGVQWLDTLYSNGINGILADEMGLGKTVQTIAFFSRLRERRFWGYFLVVGPLSTITNWYLELRRFAPSIPALLYHGTKDERAEMQRKLRQDAAKAAATSASGSGGADEGIGMTAPVIITSYEMILRDASFFQRISFRFMVVDEGHRLKNAGCLLRQAMSLISAESRILLTGTPLQNNLMELWSLLNFLLPQVFDNAENFLSWFDFSITDDRLNVRRILNQELTEKLVTKIHKILLPFMLRRTKADVNLGLPEKKELVVYSPMTREQKELYLAVTQNRVRDFIESKFTAAGCVLPVQLRNAGRNPLIASRQVCCHPYLLPHPDVYGDKSADYSTRKLAVLSGKMMLLDKLLGRLISDHKILIFSQFTAMLDIIEDHLETREIPCCRLDGEVAQIDRAEALQQFNSDDNLRVFLISTRAGGLGINLVSANIVILFDSDWNPQSDLQAQDRAHRIGQTRPVTVFRLLCRNTIEDRMYVRAQAKRALERMVIGSGKFRRPAGVAGKAGGAIISQKKDKNGDKQNDNDNEKDDAGSEIQEPSEAVLSDSLSDHEQQRQLEILLSETDGTKIDVIESNSRVITDKALDKLLSQMAK